MARRIFFSYILLNHLGMLQLHCFENHDRHSTWCTCDRAYRQKLVDRFHENIKSLEGSIVIISDDEQGVSNHLLKRMVLVCRFHLPTLRFGDWIPMDWNYSRLISRQDPPHDFHRSGGNVFSDRLQQFILCFAFYVGLHFSKLTAIGNREVIHPLASKNNRLRSGINKHRWPENGRFFTMYFLLNNGDIPSIAIAKWSFSRGLNPFDMLVSHGDIAVGYLEWGQAPKKKLIWYPIVREVHLAWNHCLRKDI